jgi:hypothetical protein
MILVTGGSGFPYVRVQTLGTANVFEAARLAGIHRPRCLCISVVSADVLDVVFESGAQ